MKKIVNGTEVDLTQAEIEEFEARESKHLQDLDYYVKSEKYKDDRRESYPSIGDQLDMLYKAMESGEISKANDFFNAIKTVKDAHPKPTE